MSVVRRVQIAFALVGLLILWGCGKSPSTSYFAPPKNEPWRAEEEHKCLAGGFARSSFVAQRAALGGPSGCGVERPFEVRAALGGRIQLNPAANVRCPMIPSIDKWMAEVVMPAAQRHFGRPVVEVKVISSFACRPINHSNGARLSEHGHGNAVDIAGFLLADGRWIIVKAGWYGDPRERAFLRHVHQGACDTFTTVLGPNYDANHRDHFHLDLAWHGRDGQTRICK